jgi:hypothetical protein
MAPEVKTAKNSKLPKLPKNCFEQVGKGGWPPISTWISGYVLSSPSSTLYFSWLRSVHVMEVWIHIVSLVAISLVSILMDLQCIGRWTCFDSSHIPIIGMFSLEMEHICILTNDCLKLLLGSPTLAPLH